MTPRELEEYRALRSTIRQRCTARVWIFVAGIAVWAALNIATASLLVTPFDTLLPLLMLAAAFEAVFALHVGVERVGRYIQVFHESPDERASWEAAAMTFGAPAGAASADPLFVLCFLLAAILNFVPVLLSAPVPAENAVIGGLHAFFIVRLLAARRVAARQRAVDLARFRELKG